MWYKDKTKIEQEIKTWIIDILGTDNPAFGDMPPCPYAKKAIMDGKVETIIVDDIDAFDAYFRMGDRLLKDEDKSVIVFVINPLSVTVKELIDLTSKYNTEFPEYANLEDHPNDIEKVDSFIVNQGTYAIMLSQPRANVEKARTALEKTKYFDKWDDKYKKDVFAR